MSKVELSFESKNEVFRLVDVMMMTGIRNQFPFDELVDEIIFSERFVSFVENNAAIDASFERGPDGEPVGIDTATDLVELVENRVRYNLSPGVARWR